MLEGAATIFEPGGGNSEVEIERRTAELYVQIGRLTVEHDFLRRRSGL